MIPLRSSQKVSRVHPFCYLVIATWVLIQILHWFVGESFLLKLSFSPADFDLGDIIKSIAANETTFDTIFSSLYFWVFAIPAFQIFKPFLLFVGSLVACIVTAYLFTLIHPYSAAPVLISPAFLGFILGAFMRRDIWGSVDTLVVGFPLKPQIFSVPSYVLLFFWFFYLLISNLLMEAPFSDAPMLYLIPLCGFLLGFLFASVKWTHATDKSVTT